MNRITGILLSASLAATLGSALTGCGASISPRGQAEPAVPVQSGVKQGAVQHTAPLTGLPVASVNRDRVIVVMVNNFSKARPQSGLDKADMVYETLEEGYISRFMAFYQSETPDVVGPVRSIRPYNINLSSGFDPIISHAGGSVAALHMLRSGGYADMDEIYSYPKAYWRVDFRKAPHNLYTSIRKLREGAVKKGYPTEAAVPTFTFKKDTEEASGAPGSSIAITYSSTNHCGYEYDPGSKQYLRTTDGKPHIDKETGRQLSATNVLVVGTMHKVVDSDGRLEVNTTGPGEGYLFQRGKAVKVTWEQKHGIIRAYRNGQEVSLYPGHTWVNIVPNNPTLAAHLSFH
ncbi:DUF3048 domain-containing protein [Aneurinibacillus sp. Ricciae_BoGa-3]|uniref:DUF3048 domain-containing protein n=1 Tax=Aneurinibacillus sp. Ricciae_BoGa-3 TaxID=3022697 RepID=UPI00233FCF2A|nr:DUF3048 domain-containing protein [Aneurinibacillus sp. Ricciae_BoGa-3]WCK55063.1 DUF3048 domain-containing protein [Aneurinibacillus sp. Ricciae_BoGa-3]